MSEVICIGTQTPAQTIEQRLQQELAFLRGEGIEISTETGRTRFFEFVRCQLDYQQSAYPEPESQLLCRQYIANVLTDLLVDEWQPQTLTRLLNRQYDCFDQHEQADIIAQARARLADVGINAPLYQISRKSRVREALSDYLRQESFLNLEGFLSFRLKPYTEELEEALAQVAEGYLAEKESQEFVRLLRSFLEVLEPKQDLVHVLITSAAEFAILDEQGELLRSDRLESVVLGDDGTPEECEDLMISSLLTISPRHLVLHTGTFIDKPDVLRLLQQVFESRVELCRDCDLCARLLAEQHPEQN